jgi:pimeloyl-ACP methyl ester carboxylesterase
MRAGPLTAAAVWRWRRHVPWPACAAWGWATFGEVATHPALGGHLRGEQGEPLVDAEGLQAAGVRVVTIPDAGHVMMEDQPEAFVAALALSLDGDLSPRT